MIHKMSINDLLIAYKMAIINFHALIFEQKYNRILILYAIKFDVNLNLMMLETKRV